MRDSGAREVPRRMGIVRLSMLFWGLAIAGRLFFLQVVEATEYRERAEQQHERVLDISPRRGPILDRNGNELAVSIEVDSLYAVPDEIENPRKTAAFLAEVLGMRVGEIEAQLISDRNFRWIKRKISQSESQQIRSAGIPGLYFQQESQRFYPNRELASHVLGFVNLDDEGAAGIEYGYDEVIAGAGGKVAVMRDARGRTFQRLEQHPTTGSTVTTTLDQNIQFIVEREIARTIEETRAAGMSVVVMRPTTGEILAMASYPDFNPNEYGRYRETDRWNRAIQQVYEPGSTFKIVTAAAALEEGLTSLGEEIDCQMGSITLHGQRINDHKPFGVLSVREALQFSSNVCLIKLGLRVGEDPFADYVSRMGFGEKTGVDLPGEERGLFRPTSQWSKISIASLSIGQEIGVTPLQVAAMVSAVANGGTLYRPYVVGKVEGPMGRARETETVSRRVLDPETAVGLRDALEAVVTDGTAKSAQLPGFTAAGKTGTAQKIDPATGRYSRTKYIASFAGFAPARDPEIAVVVVIDEPSGAYHGGEVASPSFKRIAEDILRYRGVVPDLPLPATDEEAPGRIPVRPTEAPHTPVAEFELVDVARSGEDVVIPAGAVPAPDFRGMTLREFNAECIALGLDCLSAGSGRAYAQSVAAGAPLVRGQRVEVRFSTR